MSTDLDVLFLGRLADVTGRRRLRYEGRAQSLWALRDEIFSEAMQRGVVTLADIRMSVNQEQVFEDRRIASGDEVAFFPIFSGG